MKQIINSTNAPEAIGPYNHATKASGLLFVSGQIALNPETGELVLDSIIHETHHAMKNLQAIVVAGGLSLEDVVKCTIFVTDMAYYANINSVYALYFPQATAPARELVQVVGLPRGVNVEISAIATY